MNRPPLARALLALFALAAGGCTDCGTPPSADGGFPESGTEAGTDSGTDAGTDSAVYTLCPVEPPTGMGPVSLSMDLQPLFTGSCTGATCHVLGGPGAGLVLEDGMTWASAVNVPAAQVQKTSMLDRVEPGAPDLSYLVHKLQGTHLQASVLGIGMAMPANGMCLPPADIGRIRAWIEEGALDN